MTIFAELFVSLRVAKKPAFCFELFVLSESSPSHNRAGPVEIMLASATVTFHFLYK